jgi:beta-glucosidase
VYGEYPKTMQNIVGNRLPQFTKEEVKMVKGSMDFVGINQYTTFYMYDPHQPKPKYLGYQQDWNVGFACKKLLDSFPPRINEASNFIYSFSH